MPYVSEERMGQIFDQMLTLERVAEAAEVLSTAMIASEATGSDYSAVDDPWRHLTAAIQNWRQVWPRRGR